MLRPDLAATHCDQGPSCHSAPSTLAHESFASNAAARSTGLPSQVPKASTLAGPVGASQRYTPTVGCANEANDEKTMLAPQTSCAAIFASDMMVLPPLRSCSDD